MSTNEILREADYLSAPVTAGTLPGVPIRVGGLNGVTVTKEGEGGNLSGYATVALRGAIQVTTAFAIASWGTPVYITAGNVLTDVSAGNSLYGHALSTKAAASGPLTIRITN